MRKLGLVILAILMATTVAYASGKKDTSKKIDKSDSLTVTTVELHLYAGAGLRVPAEKIIASFEEATGHKVSVEWAGMGQLVTRFKTTGVGDMFLSGSKAYIEYLKKEGAIVQDSQLVYHSAVMAIRKDKAAGINSFEDLAKSNLRLAVGDPQAIALGVAGETMLEKSGFASALRPKIAVRATSGPQLSMYLLNGDVDAAIIGRSDAVKNMDKLVLLPIPPGVPQEISVIATLATSEHPEVAMQLFEWFIKPESIAVFVNEGYLPLEKQNDQ